MFLIQILSHVLIAQKDCSTAYVYLCNAVIESFKSYFKFNWNSCDDYKKNWIDLCYFKSVNVHLLTVVLVNDMNGSL